MNFSKKIPAAQFFFRVVFVLFFCLFSFEIFANEAKDSDLCQATEKYYEVILEQVSKKNPDAIKALPSCFSLDRTLILKAVLIDPNQFQNAAEILKDDEIFVTRLLKVSPEILQFASQRLRLDKNFMERATYLNRNALQYGDSKLLNNLLFMRKMIALDSRNYIFASERLKELPEFAQMAFLDDGLLLEFAPQKIRSDKKFVKIAISSNSAAIEFASDYLKKDKELLFLARKKTSIPPSFDLEKFLYENYVVEPRKKNLLPAIDNKAQFFAKNKLIDRNYVTKWQRVLNYDGSTAGADLKLIAADSRNYPNSWRNDFKKYPDLIKKIENFFLKHRIDQITINNLSTNFLWEVKKNPTTLAFNLYLLRDSKDHDLGLDFCDITSLTAIAQKRDKQWHLSVVDVIFDSEMKVDLAYSDGHQRRILWDLLTTNKNDKNPKIIFRVGDKFHDGFEIFEEQAGGKYRKIFYTELGKLKPEAN